jgi:NAD(P)-dependent dehydrogenase (short-subunit alcohol dehydrogenase family)
MGILEGQTAVITGAGNGVGAAVARLFAQHGANLVVNDLGTSIDGEGNDPTVVETIAEELRGLGASVVTSSDDVATRSGAVALIRRCVDTFGRLDALVNCAGILRDHALLNMGEHDWRSVISTQLDGTFNCIHAAAVVMRNQRHGHIVNSASSSALLGNFGQVNAAAAAGGIVGLTRTAAIELQRYGITVNAVAPIAKTRQTEQLPMLQKTSALTPNHVAPVYLFLASALSNDVTGQILSVAGSRISVYKTVETSGRFKEADDGIWSPEEIADQFMELTRV